MLHSTIKQQFLGLCCSSLPINVRHSTVQKGIFGMETKNLLKSTEVQKVLAKPLNSTLERPVGFLTHFFPSSLRLLAFSVELWELQAAFFLWCSCSA